jgi:hypothetical protein
VDEYQKIVGQLIEFLKPFGATGLVVLVVLVVLFIARRQVRQLVQVIVNFIESLTKIVLLVFTQIFSLVRLMPRPDNKIASVVLEPYERSAELIRYEIEHPVSTKERHLGIKAARDTQAATPSTPDAAAVTPSDSDKDADVPESPAMEPTPRGERPKLGVVPATSGSDAGAVAEKAGTEADSDGPEDDNPAA